jgi:UDP-4-amino-4-deoxy-L-arabinose formyltransferase/UDP-glucuronic acid dehydrogenase (UDP-4-keto-hexauronic acid decarboxylating)
VRKFQRVAIVGDDDGIPMMLDQIHAARIACVVVASIRERPDVVSGLEARGIPVLAQPRRTSPEYVAFLEAFTGLGPDLILCNSYSMKLGPDLLGLVQGNAINAHAALLPRNRGPNPIQWAIIRGDRTTGVTLHYMSDAIDAGDIVAQREIPIGAEDTWVSVRDKSHAALRAIIADELPGILAGENGRTPQDHTKATVNSRLTPESPRIDFGRMTDDDVYNLVRAQVHPLAGAYLEINGERRRFPQMLTRSAIAQLRAQYG